MKIIGIDLSLRDTGMSDGETTWSVESTGRADATLYDRQNRLNDLTTNIIRCAHTADFVLIEQPAYSKIQGHTHDRSGLWWMVVNGLSTGGREVVEVTPSSLKLYATGKGNASKALMLDASIRRLPDIVTGSNDNRVDALWLAAMALDHHGTPLVDLPAAQRKAMEKVKW